MGSSTNDKETKKKPSFFKGLKKEFKKVTWPSKEDTAKQTVAVVVVSIILGLVIALFDFILQTGINFLVSL